MLSCVAFLVNANAQFQQQGNKLVGTNALGQSGQGETVFISSDGNTAIVAGPDDNGGVGAAWVYIRSGGIWSQQGNKLVGKGAVGSAKQGSSVSLSSDGNTAIVGGYFDNGGAGAAWVFARSGGVWTQQGPKLVGSGAVGAAYQGRSVSLSGNGNTAIVSGYYDNSNAGAIWIFTRSADVWTQQGSKLVGAGAKGVAFQGVSVSISSDGNTAITGGYGDNGNAGAAWIFTRTSGVWSQQGTKLVGTGAIGAAYQGNSVSLSSDGNTAILGGYSDDNLAGAAWVFARSGGVWTQQGPKLVGLGAMGAAFQGISVSLSSDGNTAIVGGIGDNVFAGAAWVFTRSVGVWSQQGRTLVGANAVGNAFQGVSVSISGDGYRAIIGGVADNTYIGAAWVFYNPPTPTIASVNDLPFDQGGIVMVNWTRSRLDEAVSSTIKNYWVWRGVRAGALPHQATVVSRSELAMNIASNQLRPEVFTSTNPQSVSTATRGDIYWQYVASVPSHGLAHYTYSCPTLADSTPLGTPWRYFFVTACTSDPNVYWDSPIDSGYSVDNLCPGPPANPKLVALSIGRVQLSWALDRADPDVDHYTVYRSSSNGFSITDSTRLRTTTDNTFVDSSVTGEQTYYFRITTMDIHGNESSPTKELKTTITALSGGSPEALPGEFNLGQNYPNPFNPSTTIKFELPTSLDVRLSVFDMLGRQVSVLVNERRNAGVHEVKFDGSQLSSGVYFYRLQTGGFMDTKKLLLLK
jgi:hypothetical protein